MSEIDRIYEITRSLSSPDSLKGDLKEISEIALKHFTLKYFNPINNALTSHRDYCTKHPTKEIVLLNALKPFMPKAEPLDNAINAFNTLRLFTDLGMGKLFGKGYGVTTASIDDIAIHEDGVYEIDQGCIGATPTEESYDKKDIMLVFLLLLLLQDR